MIENNVSRINLELSLKKIKFAVIDTETSLAKVSDKKSMFDIVEIAIITTDYKGNVHDKFQSLVRPIYPFNRNSCKALHINESVLTKAPAFEELSNEIQLFLSGSVIVGQNTQFDIRAISQVCDDYKKKGKNTKDIDLIIKITENEFIDTRKLFMKIFTNDKSSLDAIAQRLQIDNERLVHSAMDDADLTNEIFTKLLKIIIEMNVNTLKDLLSFQNGTWGLPEQINLFK